MNNDELDKLRVLAADGRDFYNAVLTKMRERAICNGHDMSQYDEERYSGYSGGKYPYMITSFAYCKKCPFQLEIDFVKADEGDKVYAHFDTDRKCSE